MPEAVFQFLQRSGSAPWHCAEGFVGAIEARCAEDVLPAMEAVLGAAKRGLYAVGFIAYEAASGIDPHLRTHGHGSLPLLWFGLFKALCVRPAPVGGLGAEFFIDPWRPSLSLAEYRTHVDRIRRYIATGDTYQVNYTFPLRAACRGDAWSFFVRLWQAQQAQYGAFIDTGDHAICSASPELFFSLADGVLTSWPMKGTAARGVTPAEDQRLRQELARSEKNRAENAMIVDMMRNNMGRIARTGSVAVSDVFRVEQWPPIVDRRLLRQGKQRRSAIGG